MIEIISVSETWEKLAAKERPPIQVDQPEPGYYRRRLVKNGPFVACRIWIERDIDPDTGEIIADDKYLCTVDGKPASAMEQWSWLASHAISKEEYDFMLADADWCRKYAPDDPKANPTKAINLRATKPVLPPQGGKA